MPKKSQTKMVTAIPVNINAMNKQRPLQFDIPAENVKAHKLSMNGVFVTGMKKPNPNKRQVKKSK